MCRIKIMNNPISREILLDMYRRLYLIRQVELAIEERYHEDEMKTPVHLALGQEAVAVGVCIHLAREDYVFSNHRSHAHYLAKGGDLKAMMAELYCKETGCSHGRGGSMHLIDVSVSHLGSSSIVGGSIPHAVGAAFAAQYKSEDRLAVSFFGDAASEQGVFYESMAWAKMKRLPVLFVCENNEYSVCSHITARQPMIPIAQRGQAFDIPSETVDGMNLMEVYERAQQALNHVRSGQGPYFLECRVQRWRRHAGSGDPMREKYRQPDELHEGFFRDPVKDYEGYLSSGKMIKPEDLKQMQIEINARIDAAFQYAKESPLPKKEDLEKYLYS